MFSTRAGEQCTVVPMNSRTFPDPQDSAENAQANSALSSELPSIPASAAPSHGRGRRFNPCRAHHSDQWVSADLEQCAPVQTNRTTYIYAIKGDGLIKVGRAKNVARRLGELGELQVGCPVPLKLLHAVGVPNALAVAAEATAHKHLESFWEAGEWFAVTADQAWYALEYASAIVRGREPPPIPRTKSPEEAMAEWRATKAKNRAQRMAEVAAQREASKATFLAVREKFMAPKQRSAKP